MTKNFNLAIFAILTLALLLVSWIVTGKVTPSTGPEMIWFNGGLFTLLVARFVIEYRFTKPNDVFLNCLAVFVSVSSLSNPPNADWWSALRWTSLALGVAAIWLAWDNRNSPKEASSRLRRATYALITRLGSSTVLFSAVFLLALISYFDLEDSATKTLAVTWGIILLVANMNLGSFFSEFNRMKKNEVLGHVSKFLSPRTIFFERAEGVKLKNHQIVGVRASKSQSIAPALIFGERRSPQKTVYVANLLTESVRGTDLDATTQIVSLTCDEEALSAKSRRTVGLVCEGSTVSTLNFEVLGSASITTGSLLEAEHLQGEVYYQLFDGTIVEEQAIEQSDRSFVRAKAEQIGQWDPKTNGFRTFGWVAHENSTVLLVENDAPPEQGELKESELAIGKIPQSEFPAVIDLNDLVLFHSAVLGVTGSGKSFLTFEIVESCANRDIKVVCVDPTGDYQRYLSDAVLIKSHKGLSNFLNSTEHKIAILETAINQQNPILQCHDAAQICLNWCKENRRDEEIIRPVPKVLFAMEEAHLLIPEWNFNPAKNLQDKVNQTSQIVLQARKYGLGFLIVAQRTANVLKSALNQCNTIIALQQFDQTGFDFLGNYMGVHHVKSLPNLAERHGIVVGKASASQRPILVRFNDQARDLNEKLIPDMPDAETEAIVSETEGGPRISRT